VVPVENFGSLMGVEALQEELPNMGDAYEFESISVSSTPDGVSTMASGDADIALMTTVSFANAIAQGAIPEGITAIATDFWDAHPDFYGFTTYSAADSDITEPADLEGRDLGVNATGTGIHAILVKQLVELGLDPENDVNFVELDFPAFTQAILDGRFDAGIYPPLLAGQARAEGFTEVFRSQNVFEPYPFAYNVAANRSLDEKGDAMAAWAEDFAHLVDFARNNRSSVIPPAAAHFELPEPALDGYFLTENDYFREDLEMDIAALNTIMDEMVELGFVSQDRDYAQYASNEYLP
jgi:NitT/TauT family transport system substrate-binding protein